MTKMKPALCLVAVAVLLSACSDGSSSSSSGSNNDGPYANDRAHKIITVMNGKPGINLGNVFEAPNDNFDGTTSGEFTSSWNETIKDADFKALADSGFGNIRIPIRWDTHFTDNSCTIDSNWMARVFWAVKLTVDNGMIAVVNSHHWQDMYDHPDSIQACLLNVYTQLTNKVKAYSPDSVIIELLNEPRDSSSAGTGLTSDKWNTLIDTTIKTIRAIDPNRVIMAGTYNYNSYSTISNLVLPDVENLIVTFHYYDPFAFTHQGATFVTPEYPTGTTWDATASERRTVRNAFNAVKTWADANGRPVYLGEFGSYEAADSASRELWTEYVSKEAKALGFGYAYWEFCSGFGVYDDANDTWNEFLIRALVHPVHTFEETQHPDLDTVGYVLLDDFNNDFADTLKNVNDISARRTIAAGKKISEANGSWYAYHVDGSYILRENGDTLITGNLISYDTVKYAGKKAQFYNMITKNGYKSNGLYAKILLKGDSYPWAGIGTTVDGDTTFNFANLKALTFKAKGSGVFRIAWSTAFTDTCCADIWGAFVTEVTLSSEWKDYTIWYDDWAPTPWSDLETEGYEWIDHNDAVSKLQFSPGSTYGEVADDTLEIYLDDIRFYGMSDSDFGISK
jgi:aryl-phospho-beta-D-glucosidase BglC (GH1 family)